jgi:hypothetical protein
MTGVIRIEGEGAKRLQAALNNLQGKVGKVGWFEKSKYPDIVNPKTKKVTKGPPVAMIAAINEEGWPARNIPPRPFMRPTIIAKQKSWAKIAESESKKIIAGTSTIGQAMEIIGSVAKGEIQETISAIHSPVLKEATIKNRVRQMANTSVVGNLTKPLVFTEILRGTLYNTVESL